MDEKDPSFKIKLPSGRKLDFRPENSALYTFLGETVIGYLTIDNTSVNHAWITLKQREGRAKGMYFFEEFDQDFYKKISDHMLEHKYPMFVNQRVVPECDLAVWLSRVDEEAEKFGSEIPDKF